MRVAVLDHEPTALVFLQDVLAKYVSLDGSAPISEGFSNSVELLRRLKRETFDLIFLDWEITESSGLELLLRIVESLKPTPPVIVLASRIIEEDVVSALNAGADEFILKPVRQNELFARVKKIMRHSELKSEVENSTCFFSFGNIRFDVLQSKVYVGAEPALLTLREFSLALLFFKNWGRTLSRGYIYNCLWMRDEALCSRTLDSHVYRIRTKLRLNSDFGWILKTVYGYGYRLESLSIEKG